VLKYLAAKTIKSRR